MLTIFATPKPFCGHIGVIQRNAIESWKRLDPDVEIILIGDDEGTSEICRELGLVHIGGMERDDSGTLHLDALFSVAQGRARHDLLAYVNCDIVLTDDFLPAVRRLQEWGQPFLMVGRRWDTDITEPLDFKDSHWQERIRERAFRGGFQRLYYNIDYFVFSRGLYRDVPRLAIGRRWWDQWLVWGAQASGASVVDATDVVWAVHQNHDYGHVPGGMPQLWYGEQAQRNFQLAGGWGHLHTLEDARFLMTSEGIRANLLYWLAPAKRWVRRASHFVKTKARLGVWFPILNATRPIRRAIGLDRRVVDRYGGEPAVRRHPLDR